MKKSVKEINTVGLIVEDLSSKKKWISMCLKNEKLIKKKINKEKKFKGLVLDILLSRMDLYKSWYPNLNEKDYLSLLIKQGAEYTSMGEIISKK